MIAIVGEIMFFHFFKFIFSLFKIFDYIFLLNKFLGLLSMLKNSLNQIFGGKIYTVCGTLGLF